MANVIRNRFGGVCAYCGHHVSEGKGVYVRYDLDDRPLVGAHVFHGKHHRIAKETDIPNFVTRGDCAAADSKFETTSCREAWEEDHRNPEGARRKDPWKQLTSGEPAPAKRVTVDEAMQAGKNADVFPEAEQLQAMLDGALNDAVDAITKDTASEYMRLVPPLVAELLATARPIEISVGDLPKVKLDRAHKALETVLKMVVAGGTPFLVGPAGSGKTTLAEQIAKALGRTFYMASAVRSEYKLVGFTDANGKTVRTAFREAYEHGGVFLFDEVDSSEPDVMTTFNSALANGYCDFPDRLVDRHPDFIAMAAGNTYGRGADRQYVGRNQLDAATLDRFQVYEVDYDEDLEHQIAGNRDWSELVQAIRKHVLAEKVRHVVSPRASIMGARYLAAGMDVHEVLEAVVWKGLDSATKGRVIAAGSSEISNALAKLMPPKHASPDGKLHNHILAAGEATDDEEL